jgi:hypothetical protein
MRWYSPCKRLTIACCFTVRSLQCRRLLKTTAADGLAGPPTGMPTPAKNPLTSGTANRRFSTSSATSRV